MSAQPLESHKMSKISWFEKLRRKGRVKHDAIVADPGLTSMTSSSASLAKPSQAPLPLCLPDTSSIPIGVRKRVDSIGNTTPPKSSSTLSEVTSPALTNLWKKATEAMQNDPDSAKRELAQQYAETLVSEFYEPQGGPGAEDPSHLQHEQVAERLNAKVEKLSQERLTVSLGSRELDIEPLFNNVSKHIVAARDLINSAAGAEPHAALACAGGLVILTFLVRPIEQREHILRGLELTSSLICRYFAMEQVYRPRARVESIPVESARRLELDLERNLVSLYTKIIEFQARALCYLQRSRSTRFIRDMFRGDTWKTLIEEIDRLDAQCRAVAELITHDKILNFIESPSQMAEQAIVTINLPPLVSDDLSKRRTQLLSRLYTCPYRDRKDINPERAPGTCEWFTEHEYFLDWKVASESRMLWVSADPGAGKSVLAKYLVDDVFPSTPDRTTSYFFFKDGFDDQNNARAAMCAVLRQILEQNSELMDESTVTKFEADGNHLVNSFSGLFDMVLEAARRLKNEVICLFDAVDECNEDDCRQVTATLAKFYKNPPKDSCLKFIVTSRPYARIQRSLQPLETSIPTIHLRGDDEFNTERISGEIGIVIRHRLQSIAQIQLLEAKEIKLLEESLLTWKHRTYLWVKLAIDFIESRLEYPTQENVETIFNSVPEKLDGLYEKILERSANKERARKAFHIILGAHRPLSLSEISGALFIESHHKNASQMYQEPIKRFPSYLREICGLFVTVVDGKVYLLHETAREFLAYRTGHGALQSTWLHSITPKDSHFTMAKACVWYLLLEDLGHYRGEPDPRSLSGFSKYALIHWTRHVKEFEEEHPCDIDSFGNDVVSLCKAVTSKTMTRRKWMLFSVELIREENSHWSESCLNIFLEQQMFYDPDPLIFATQFGLQSAVSKLLLEDPHRAYKVYEDGETILWWAAELGQVSIIRFLLTKYVDSEFTKVSLNRQQPEYTPLVVAIKKGHKAAVEALLQDPRTSLAAPDGVKPHWKPVHYAAYDGNSFQLLLADPRTFFDFTSEDQRILLEIVFRSGSMENLKSLLHDDRFEAGFCSSDPRNGRTSFCKLAASRSHSLSNKAGAVYVDMMKLLLETYSIDVAKPDYQNRSPVSWAACCPNNTTVLSYLLFELHLEPDGLDDQGRSPLSYSAGILGSGAPENMNVLLKTNRVNINSVNIHGRTPLMIAADADYLDSRENYTVSPFESKGAFFLLNHGADINIRDTRGRTVLTYATGSNALGLVKELIKRGAEVNLKDVDGRTALSFAAQFADPGVVALLLNAGENPCLSDNEGRTPLLWHQQTRDIISPAPTFGSLGYTFRCREEIDEYPCKRCGGSCGYPCNLEHDDRSREIEGLLEGRIETPSCNVELPT